MIESLRALAHTPLGLDLHLWELHRYAQRAERAFHDWIESYDDNSPKARRDWRPWLELIRSCGHLILWEGGIHYAEIKSTVRAGVSAPDD